jgi:hypothetical protein
MRYVTLVRVGIFLAAFVLAGCGRESAVAPSPTPTSTPGPCPTVARMVPPQLVLDHQLGGIRLAPGASPTPSWPPREIWSADKNFLGHDALWLQLPDDGVVRGRSAWILEYQLGPGHVAVSARPLDGSTAKAEIEKDDNPGGGPRDRSATIHFPAPGCWEITYTLAGRDLRFVLRVEF